MNFKLLSFITVVALFIAACTKKPEMPPTKKLSDGKVVTIAELRSIATCTNSCSRTFSTDTYVNGMVLTDEISGNFYNELYMRDGTGAIRLEFKNNNNLLVGDSIRVNLKNKTIAINSQSSLLEVIDLDFEINVTKISSGANPSPVVLDNIAQVNSSLFCNLVKINNVEFAVGDTSKKFADPITLASVNLNLNDCGGNVLVVRSSGYSKFAGQKPPKGKGSIIGIVTNYSSTEQLIIRKVEELDMSGSRCIQQYMIKNFNDNSVTSGNWIQQNVTGGASWTSSTFNTAANSTPFARISGFIGGVNTNTENWLISPAINLTNATSPVLSFSTAAKFSGNPLEVLVSTNYTGGAPSSATWTNISSSVTLSPNSSNYTWTFSNNVSMNAFKMNNVRIAFKYSSTTAGSTTYQLDDIILKEN